MFPHSKSEAARKRERMFDACQIILQSASALNFLHEILDPPSGTEKLELSTDARYGLAHNLKILSNAIYDSLDLIPDTETALQNLLDPNGGENV